MEFILHLDDATANKGKRKNGIHLIPEEGFDELERIFKMGSLFLVWPFKWCRKDYLLKLDGTKIWFLYFYALGFMNSAIYFTIQFVRYSHDKENSLSYLLAMLSATLSWLVFLADILFIKCSEDIATLVTSTFHIIYEFEERFVPFKGKTVNQQLIRLMKGIYISPWISASVTFFAVLLFAPTEPVFLYAELPKEYQHPVLLISLAVSSFFGVASAAWFSVICLELLLIIYEAFKILRKELLPGNPNYKSRDVVRNSADIVIKYNNAFQYLLQYTQQTFGMICGPIQSLMTRYIMLWSVILIKQYHNMHPLVLLSALPAIIFVFFMWSAVLLFVNKTAELYNAMLKNIDNISKRNVVDITYLNKVKLSRKEFKFRIGLDEPISVQSIPNFILSLSRGTMKILTIPAVEVSEVFDFI